MARMLSPGTTAKLARVRWMIAALPSGEREAWTELLSQALAPVTVAGAHVETLPPAVQAQLVPPAPAPTGADVEWDLALANWLDRVYGVTAARVAEVATAAKRAAKANARELAEEATGSIGRAAGLVVAGAAAALLLAWRLGRR